jgi:hypothetical protein
MSSATSTIDEFGRDLSLKSAQQNNSFKDYFVQFKGMSWADICYQIDEEEEKEEEERKIAEREALSKILAERKVLHNKGLYEFEEGEELDL